MFQAPEPIVYQLKIVLLGISPMIWRRLLVRGDCTITYLHYILQIAMGWSDDHLNCFKIHGLQYGVFHDGEVVFNQDPDEIRLGDFQFRINEWFLYEYDFTDRWRHQIRIENILEYDPRKDYPLCIGGHRACPPENCGGPWRFMALRQHYSLIQIMDRFFEIIEAEDPEDHVEELYTLRHKGHHPLTYHTLFGKLRLRSMRFYHCDCQPQTTKTFSPLTHLLPEHTAPELLYLESKFASLMSYGLSMQMLNEVLPIGQAINAATIRNHVQSVARRIDAELGDEQMFLIDGCEWDWEGLPRPDMPITVGLDGGYVHSCAQKTRKHGWFEVIAGKSVANDGACKRFAFVHNYDEKPKRRVSEFYSRA